MALTRIVIALVQAEQLDRARLLLQEAEAVAYSMEDDDDSDAASYKELSDRDFALNELVKAQTIALDVEGAEAAARSMSKDQHPLKDLALCQVIRVLAKTQQWDRAIELIRHIGEHKWRVSAWTTVSDAFIAQGEYARALRLIQERWIHAPTRNDLLQLLPLAMDFIALRPELGWEFYEAFSWTDKFLEA